MPPYISGKLQVSTRAALGGGAVKEGTPVEVDVPFGVGRLFSGVVAYAGWIVLFLLLVFLPSNRFKAAWWAVVPVLFIELVAWATTSALPMPSEVRNVFHTLFMSLAFALGALFLLGNLLRQGGRRKGIVFGIFLAALLSGLYAYGGIGGARKEYWIYYCTAMLVGLFLSAIFFRLLTLQRRKFAWLRVIGLGVEYALLIALLLGILVSFFLFRGQGWNFILRQLFQVCSGGLLLGAISYLLLIPFYLTYRFCPFYRQRFDAFLPPCVPPFSVAEVAEGEVFDANLPEKEADAT